MGNRRWLAACVVGLVLTSAGSVVLLRAGEPAEPVFCDLAARIPAAPEELGGFIFYIDPRPAPQGPCGPGYMAGDMGKVDGVLFADCVVWWSSGGTSNAESANIPCAADRLD